MCRHVLCRSMTTSSGRFDGRQGLLGSPVPSGDAVKTDEYSSSGGGSGLLERMSLPHLPLGVRDWELNLDALQVAALLLAQPLN